MLAKTQGFLFAGLICAAPMLSRAVDPEAALEKVRPPQVMDRLAVPSRDEVELMRIPSAADDPCPTGHSADTVAMTRDAGPWEPAAAAGAVISRTPAENQSPILLVKLLESGTTISFAVVLPDRASFCRCGPRRASSNETPPRENG